MHLTMKISILKVNGEHDIPFADGGQDWGYCLNLELHHHEIQKG